MPPIPKSQIVHFWLTGSKKTLRLANDVFKSRYYDHALFCGHLALEKLLKAKVVDATDGPSPRSHDLLYLAGLARLDVPEDKQKQLTEINGFNIAGRYQEEKLAFHKRITKAVGSRWLAVINELYIWLLKQNAKN